jgi:hypothetical protein
MEEKHEFTDWVNLISSGKYKTETEKLAISKKLEEEQKIKDKKKKDDDDMTTMIASCCHF